MRLILRQEHPTWDTVDGQPCPEQVIGIKSGLSSGQEVALAFLVEQACLHHPLQDGIASPLFRVRISDKAGDIGVAESCWILLNVVEDVTLYDLGK